MKIFATATIADRMQEDPLFGKFINNSIRRHLCGDWGDISEADRESNNHTPKNTLSAYHTSSGVKIWIIQTGDTITILFPWEY